MQNNSIFGVNLLLFPVKTKTEIKNNLHVICSVPLVPERTCRVAVLNEHAEVFTAGAYLTQHLENGSLVKAQEALANSNITMTPVAQNSNYKSTSFCYQ